jgi:hypothetical protein
MSLFSDTTPYQKLFSHLETDSLGLFELLHFSSNQIQDVKDRKLNDLEKEFRCPVLRAEQQGYFINGVDMKIFF